MRNIACIWFGNAMFMYIVALLKSSELHMFGAIAAVLIGLAYLRLWEIPRDAEVDQ